MNGIFCVIYLDKTIIKINLKRKSVKQNVRLEEKESTEAIDNKE